jgi:carboxynorspermidine decarboxylase
LGLLEKNLKVLQLVQARTGCKILLALKGFAAWSTFGLCRQYLAGAAASSLHEARLAREFFDKEVHLCAPGYRDDEMEDYIRIVDDIVFNSFTQWMHFRDKVLNAPRKIRCGIRVNPMHSEVKTRFTTPVLPARVLGRCGNFSGKISLTASGPAFSYPV